MKENIILIFKILKAVLILVFVLVLLVGSHFLYSRFTAYSDLKVNLQGILAYTPFPSYNEGAEIPVFYHTSKKCSAQLYRLEENLVAIGPPFKLNPKEQDNTYSPVRGFNWNEPYTISAKDLKSGYYLLKIKSLETSDEYNLPIIITPSKPYKVAVVANTNTWQAYNTFGGRSYYDDEIAAKYVLWLYSRFPSLKPLSLLPFKRPYKEVAEELRNQNASIEEFDIIETIKDYKTANLGSSLMRGEWTLAGFLEKNKIEYGVYSDFDFCSNPYIDDADIIVFHVHSEYWSEEMMGKLNSLIEKGKKIAFLSGNNIYREIENTEYGIQVTKETIDGAKTRSLCGSYYTDPIFPKLGAYKVMDENHWVFKGCNVKRGDLFGKMGASGNETDKIGFDTKGFNTLAIGTNYSGPAYMIMKENSNGGFIFNSSSLMFAKLLQRDSVLDRIVLNLIEH